jgi:adenylate cyclase
MNYTAIGNTVNIASRLEGMTRQLRVPVVVSDALIQMAGRESEDGTLSAEGFTNAGVHSIRGMATPLMIWVMEEPAPTEAGLALRR